MKITICGSLDFFTEMKEIREKLVEAGHEIFMPATAEKILAGKVSIDEINQEKGTKAFSDRVVKTNAIKYHYNKIKESDAILVINISKKGIDNYVGGNTFLEIGFAYILEKKIFMLNNMPEIAYSDEIEAMQPIVLNNDLSKIK